MVTLRREYEALNVCRHMPLAPQIMLPTTASVFSAQPFRIPPALKRCLDGSFNASQVKAIESVANTKGFSLIQGPPGTGKTKTILGILAVLLSAPPPNQQRSEAHNKAFGLDRSSKAQVLVCAPSNAAVDETVLRISEGLWNSQGEVFFPKIVRHGTCSNPKVEPFTLDYQVERALQGFQQTDRTKLDEFDRARQGLGEELSALSTRIQKWQERLEEAREEGALPAEHRAQAKLQKLHASKKQLNSKTNELRLQRGAVSEHLSGSRRRLCMKILAEANVICTTLSGSGHNLFKELQFPTVIIDEAAQAVEVSTLIPLCHGAIRAILIGDPNQLPATVLSRAAQDSCYQQSLFERLNLCGVRMHMLDTQYRMNPMISAFPSRFFYDGKLKDGPATAVRQTYHDDPDFGSFVAYAVPTKEQSNANSIKNPEEARALVTSLQLLLTRHPSAVDQSIGVITPYKGQVVELRRRLRQVLGDKLSDRITVNTVDGFQGAERDIIFFSCVRASSSGSIGFLTDTRRMNVGLTRAKHLLAVFSNPTALSVNVSWSAFFDYAKREKRFLQFSDSADKRPSPSAGGAAKRIKLDGADPKHFQ